MEFRFYVFTNLSTKPTAPSFVARFFLPLCSSYDLRWRYPSLYVFYLPLYETYDLRWPHLSLFEER